MVPETKKFEIEIGDYKVENSFNMNNNFTVENGKISFKADDCRMWGGIVRFVKK